MSPFLKFFIRFLFALVVLSTAQAADILLVTNDNIATQSLNDFLVGEGHTVTREARTNGPGNVSSFDLIIVARETNSTQYDEGTEPADWNGLGLPMINMAPHLMRSNRWGWVNGNNLPNLTLSSYNSPFLNPTHPIVLGTSNSVLNPAFSATGINNSLPAGTQQIATMGSGTLLSHGLFVIPSRTSFFSGRGTSGNVRIGFLRGDSGSWSNASANGELLLNNAINWALGELGPPTLDNSPASAVASSSATVGGVVTDTGANPPTVTIYYGDNDGGTDPAAWDSSIDLGLQSGSFSTVLSSLNPETRYYFRSFGANALGEDWADNSESFTTLAPPNPPSIVNRPATGISFTRAELNGEVTSTGGEAPEVIIYWGTTDGGTDPQAWEQSIAAGNQSGTFAREITNLINGTTYFFRSAATNFSGIVWAPSTASFTTLAFRAPLVSNGSANEVTAISATIFGEVTDVGGSSPNITVFYGTSDGGTNAAAWSNSVDLGEQESNFSTILSGLSPLTQYFFRIFAENGAGEVWSSASGEFVTSDLSPLIINEFLASNDGGYSNFPNPNQVPGLTDDWIEILNVSSSPISLDGWFLTDDAGDLSLWPFPAGTTVEAGGFLLVYASGDDVPDANGNLHSNFRLSAGGEYLALVRPSFEIASAFNEDGSDYPNQGTDVSYGINPITSFPVFFAEPTPGAPNDPAGVNQVGDTSFSVDRGIYDAPFQVEISSSTEGATIYYSIDGNPPINDAGTPTASAIVYTDPVSISQTTILRAAGVMTGLSPTNIDTQTYLLIDVAGAGSNGLDPAGLNAVILNQTQPAGFPSLTSGDYNMDQDVSRSTDQVSGLPAGTSEAQALIQGLVDIPSLSIAMNFDDFAGPSNGIYTNSQQSGFAWERACSVELIQGDNSDAWQESCGIRVQGGASRIPSRSPKHGLSLRFREIYGAGKLREDLFPESEVDTFDTLAIRAVYNNSWVHSDAGQRGRASLIRDQWARSTMLDMGNPEAGNGMMVHLYINGLYWGVHNLTERQNAAHYAEHNGGDSDLLDARNGGSIIDGNSTAWDAMRAVVNGGDWALIQQVLDVDTHIDYQIMNRYGGNSDLSPGNNWRAAGGGAFPAGQPELMAPWQLYAWDTERTLEDETSSLEVVDPAEIRTTLLTNSEYRIRFADRLQKHFFNGGALAPDQTAARWLEWAAVLNRPIIAESARWGDHRGSLNSRDDEWLTEQSRMINTYFPVRSTNVIQDFRDTGIFPDIDAPEFQVSGFPQHGGRIPSENSLSLLADDGTIYYTIDGSDPRLEGGGINPNALTVTSGGSLSLVESSLVRTRALDAGEWSALNEAVFFLGSEASGNLVISEIMYHPASDLNDEEYLVLMNTSTTETIDLSAVAFDDGVEFVFTLGTELAPLERIVVVADQVAYAAAYSESTLRVAAGEFSGSLSNGGESIGLTSPEGDVQRFTYDDENPWPESPDGVGTALVLAIPTSNPDHSLPESWRAGSPLGTSDYDTWAGLYPGVDLSDPDSDFDGDGHTNREEQIWGLDPTDSSSVNPYVTTLDITGALSYTRRDSALSGLTYSVWISTNLEDWVEDTGAAQVAGTPDGNDVEIISVTISSIFSSDQLFVQIRARE